MYKAQTDLLMFATCHLLLIVLMSNVKAVFFFLSYYFALFFGFDNVAVIAV